MNDPTRGPYGQGRRGPLHKCRPGNGCKRISFRVLRVLLQLYDFVPQELAGCYHARRDLGHRNISVFATPYGGYAVEHVWVDGFGWTTKEIKAWSKRGEWC